MKKLFLYVFLILFCPSISSADTISEYEVGGLQLGKSLYELMSQEEIIENVVNVSENQKYYTVSYIPNIFIYSDLDFGLYMATFDIDDEELKIVSFFAFEYFKNDFEGCLVRSSCKLTFIKLRFALILNHSKLKLKTQFLTQVLCL